MLYLVFHLDQNRYMLDARQVAEVLPLVEIMDLPQSPPGVAGVFNYRGTLVPAVDLSQVVLGRPAQRRLHTRIVLVRFPTESGASRLLGCIVEKVTDTRQLHDHDFHAPGASTTQPGAVFTDHSGLAQRIEIAQLLPAAVRALLPEVQPEQRAACR
jgi:chemotaxis-related protein WspB